MNLPFFYPEHPEFKAHVKYVTDEMWRFSQEFDDLKFPYRVAEMRAKDIVLWVGSRQVSWWELLIDRITGRTYQRHDEQFEAALDSYLREKHRRAQKGIAQHVNGDCPIDQFEAALLKRLVL